MNDIRKYGGACNPLQDIVTGLNNIEHGSGITIAKNTELINFKKKLRSMTIKEIITELGGQGLVCDGVDCGCGMDDLCPCGCDPFECKPAKEIVATQEDIDELNTEAEVGDLLYQGFPFYNEEEK